MKILKLIIVVLGGLLTIASCDNNPKTSTAEPLTETETSATIEVPDMHTSKNSLDWAGTYTATLPCADCPGIDATIVLHQDQTYEKTLVYQEKKDGTFNEKGKFTWNKEGNTITLDSKASPSFRVKEGSIVMLDSDGKEVSGALADKYILKKK